MRSHQGAALARLPFGHRNHAIAFGTRRELIAPDQLADDIAIWAWLERLF